MAAINALDDGAFRKLERDVQGATRGKDALESAAAAYTSFFYNELKESVVLTRFFAAVPFETLTEDRVRFVSELARANGLSDNITKETMVLSLLGTAGVEADWNDCTKSKGHLGIPLATSAFADAVPMVSRLLHQMGAGVDWIDLKDTSIVARALGLVGGVFHVEDASNEVDSKGRKIIAAQQFVQTYGVKSVFGFGGGYAGTSVFVVGITFLRDTIDRATAERFLSHVNRFKTSTMDVVGRNALFAAP